MEYKGIEYLKSILTIKRRGVKDRYKYYEMKSIPFDFGISTPPELKHFNSVIGWCSKGVDSLADRLDVHGFKNDFFNIADIYAQNNKDILFDEAILGALISSCDFIYISPDENGYPRLQVIDGGNATGIIEPITGMLNEGYAVLERDKYDVPIKEAYFRYEDTAYYENGELVEVWTNPAPYPLLVPVVYRPDAVRPFGHSRITRACMSLVGSALRTIKRSEISGEFYSFPQKYVTGLDRDAQTLDKWKSAMSAMITLTTNEDGVDHAKFGQFTQQSMTPHTDQLRMFASLFAGEMGLTLDDLGFPQSNPSSYDAIKAAHESLRLTARKAQKNFAKGFINAGFLAACMRDGYEYKRSQLAQTDVVWMPVFPADVSMLGSIGDALGKIETAIPGYMTEEKLYELTGF